MNNKHNIKIVVVHSKTLSIRSVFIKEQVSSLEKLGIKVMYFTIDNKGFSGYSKSIPLFRKFIKKVQPDLIHAHYGLSGLIANSQRKVPVITTFHGSDIYNPKIRLFSKIAFLLSRSSIFVSHRLKEKLNVKKGIIITCGVDTEIFKPINNLNKENFILFSGSFDKEVKNYPLGIKSINHYNSTKKKTDQLFLKELKNKNRNEVAQLMNKAQALLICSFYEGSSQVLKEAMACNCPVIATDVGSVSELMKNKPNCGIIVNFNHVEISNAIGEVVQGDYDNGRKIILDQKISIDQVAQRLILLYKNILNK